MASPSENNKVEDLKTEAIRFCEDPDAFFGSSQSTMNAVSRDRVEALQLEGLKYRFDTLVDKIPMLNQLASGQGVSRIDSLNDVIPLLFEHTMYKSYPPVLLEKNRFADINKFISRLTTFDLSDIDVSGCQSIDEWYEVMDRESDIVLCHSSGTSGVMSFLPYSKNEWDKMGRASRTLALGEYGGEELDMYCVYPFFRSGGSSHLRSNDNVVKYIVGTEDRFIAAYPGRLSSDVLYLAARIRAAKAQGKLDRLSINPALKERLKEFEQLQQDMPAYLESFFESTIERMRGKRVWLGATWNILHNMAKTGLEKGLEGVFAPDSAVITGGGAKGMVPPENWREDVCRFMGVDELKMFYGMSEVMGQHLQCSHGHYHLNPAAICFVLDPDTSEPLPRQGKVTGRAAFFDLAAESRWGGFISGDEITVNWDEPCTCGRQTAYIEGEIQRYSEKQGGDDKITCAATESAHKEAMDFLTQF